MKILVCIKQVPDSTVRPRVAPDGRSVVTEGITWSISPYDEYAIELALERKDADPSTVVGVVTVGPARARDALRQALAMGCDEATHVTVDDAPGALATARVLGKVAAEQKPDVVLCGKQASDDDQGLVGAAVAEALGWPHVGIVTRFAPSEGGIEVWKETEGGHEVWKADGPVLLTVQKSARDPRYPSLPGIMKAKKKEIPEKPLATLLSEAERALSAPEILAMEPPPPRGGGKILKDGDARSLAAELVRLLRDEAKAL